FAHCDRHQTEGRQVVGSAERDASAAVLVGRQCRVEVRALLETGACFAATTTFCTLFGPSHSGLENPRQVCPTLHRSYLQGPRRRETLHWIWHLITRQHQYAFVDRVERHLGGFGLAVRVTHQHVDLDL